MMQQQTQSRRGLTTQHKPLTPIEKLLADKVDIKAKCRMQEKKLNEDFTYIQNNASGLLLSGVSTLLFPPRNSSFKNEKQSSHASGNEVSEAKKTPISASDYLNIAKSLLPIAWEISQPLLITWIIGKSKSLFHGLFTKKKKISPPS